MQGFDIGMTKKLELDEPTQRIAERLLSMPPKPHADMKVGKPNHKVGAGPKKAVKRVHEHKERPPSKGRVHKGKTGA